MERTTSGFRRPALRQGLLLFVILCSLPTISLSKKISGDVRLSGVNTEQVLASFAVGTFGGLASVQFSSKEMYENERFLKLRVFRDTEWKAFQNYALCTEKARLASDYVSLSFDWVDGKWRTHEITLALQNKDGSSTDRAHYWYLVLDDCSLEQVLQDSRIPTLHFDMDLRNYVDDQLRRKTHLPADDQHLAKLHTITFVSSAVVTVLLLIHVGWQQAHTHVVHAAVLFVTAAAGLDAASSFLEILHIKAFERNGIGIYFVDALSAHCEAICDSLLMMLLLSVGAGWTLPHDAVRLNPNARGGWIQDLATPSRATGALVIGILALHVILAQWGRIYDDDFESYHTFAHLPGRLMMLMRVCTGVIFLAASVQTRLHCKAGQLQVFYAKLTLLGFAWFQSLPILTFVCNKMVSYHLQGPAVVIGTALSQSICILLLAWLVTSHSSAYHQYSHISAGLDKEVALSESLAGGDSEGRIWKMGKAKIRLD